MIKSGVDVLLFSECSFEGRNLVWEVILLRENLRERKLCNGQFESFHSNFPLILDATFRKSRGWGKSWFESQHKRKLQFNEIKATETPFQKKIALTDSMCCDFMDELTRRLASVFSATSNLSGNPRVLQLKRHPLFGEEWLFSRTIIQSQQGRVRPPNWPPMEWVSSACQSTKHKNEKFINLFT